MQSIPELQKLATGQFAKSELQKLQMDFINRYKVEDQSLVTMPDVSHTDMGFVIGYYTYARYTQNIEYEQYADYLLDKIMDDLPKNRQFCLDNGLLGVGCGIIYLLRNHFVRGDEDEIVSGIDSQLLTILTFSRGKTIIDWHGCLYYFRLRILGKHSVDNIRYNLAFRQFLIFLLDCLIQMVFQGLELDDLIISEVQQFHQMKLYPERTAEILGLKKRNCADSFSYPVMPTERITFIIPLRVDSLERERNLDLLLECLSKFDNADIRILEGDKKQLYQMKKEYRNVVYSFVKDDDPVFYRTRYLNVLLREAESPIVGIWDTDVMIPDSQIKKALLAIKEGKAVMSFPYDGHFYMLSSEESELFVQEKSLDKLINQVEKGELSCGPDTAVGGAFIVNKEVYLQAGGENEHFYGWSHEDSERVKRMQILDLPIFRAQGPLFHLYHPRKENSWYGSEDLELRSQKEFLRICGMTQVELWDDIHSW